MDKIIFEYAEHQKHAAQGGGYSKYPGYEVWYKEDGVDELLWLAFVRYDLLDTALWFYVQEDDLEVIVMKDETITHSFVKE